MATKTTASEQNKMCQHWHQVNPLDVDTLDSVHSSGFPTIIRKNNNYGVTKSRTDHRASTEDIEKGLYNME